MGVGNYQESMALAEQTNRETDQIIQKLKAEESNATAIGAIIGAIILFGIVILILNG